VAKSALAVRIWGEGTDAIRYIEHPSFTDPGEAEGWRGSWAEAADEQEFAAGHMDDDLTRQCARRMHYAAYQADRARRPADADRWRRRYYALRDRIILGNRKLVFSAVRKRLFPQQAADDLVGDCYVVMIRAVAAYNPWLGIRFSTYAFTCLMRALTRLTQRSAADRLAQHLSLEQLVEQEPARGEEPSTAPPILRVEEYLRDDHPLLSEREKAVIRRRFRLAGRPGDATLERVGRDLGISKERVRQVQATALDKLRQALAGGVCR
jgi:RNA polymerase sigma factor (sigma-70 family)